MKLSLELSLDEEDESLAPENIPLQESNYNLMSISIG
jgi:hypothetical protein